MGIGAVVPFWGNQSLDPPSMKQTILLYLCVALPLVTACAAAPPPAAGPLAQTPTGSAYGPSEGESELTFGGSLGVTKTKIDFPGAPSNTDTTLNGQVGYGRYLTDNHEVGGQVIFNITKPDQGSDSGVLGILPYYRYNFRQSDRTWFYGGVHAGLQQFKGSGESDTGLSCGIHGGMKSWLTPQVSFFVEPRLTFSDLSIGPVDLELTEFRTLLGFSYSL